MRRCGAVLALAALVASLWPVPEAMAQAKKRKPAVSKAMPVKVPDGKPGWRFMRRANQPTLIYGAGVEDFQISFSCQPETGLLRVVAQIGSRGLQPGDGAPIRLASGKSRFEVAGTAFATEAGKNVDIGGATRFDPQLFVLFKNSDHLTVEVRGRKRTLPTGNAGPSADAFQKACTATAATQRPSAG